MVACHSTTLCGLPTFKRYRYLLWCLLYVNANQAYEQSGVCTQMLAVKSSLEAPNIVVINALRGSA